MNKIIKLLKKGWVIDEIRFDRYQNFHYVGATHESGEASASGAGPTLDEAMDMMYQLAIKSTPAWYVNAIESKSSPIA